MSPQGPSRTEGLEVNAPAQPPLVMESHARRLTSSEKKFLTNNAHEDKAQDSLLASMEKTGESLMNQATASCADSLRDSAIAWLDSLHTMPIQPGGVMISPGSQDQRTIGCATALMTAGALKAMRDLSPSCLSGGCSRDQETKTATGQEAASAQAENRGHMVTMVEVPNEEDNTAYQW